MPLGKGATWAELRVSSSLGQNGLGSGEERSITHRGIKGSGMETYKVWTSVII